MEPITGTTFRELARTQINAKIGKETGVITGDIDSGYQDWFPKVQEELYVPVVWFEQNSVATTGACDNFKQIYMAQSVESGSLYGGIAGSIIFGLPLIYLVVKRVIYKS